MPRNRLIQVGIAVLVVTVLVWIGAELTRRILWLLPWIAAVAIVLIVAGVVQEFRGKGRRR